MSTEVNSSEEKRLEKSSSGNRTSSRYMFVPAMVASGLTVTAVVYHSQRRLLQLHILWSISPDNLLFNHHCSMLWNVFLLLTGNRTSSRQSFVPATVVSGLTVTAVVYHSQRRLLQLHIRWSISPVRDNACLILFVTETLLSVPSTLYCIDSSLILFDKILAQASGP
ncbi:hypothetical protein J6590_075861 [Homalodisca vitripennis]|nr:hypothetical protein J6590_075861 [Homalodisca vitripennis]